MKYVLIYLFMLIFDFAVAGGAIWLIGWHGWNAWWFLVAVIFSFGSNPSNLIKMARKDDYERIHPGSRVSY